MQEIVLEEYNRFLKEQSQVKIGNKTVKLTGKKAVSTFGPSKEYSPEKTTVWSFPERGEWATHKGDYPGNWTPYIPRNLLLRYTEENDLVLDPMMGSGTSIVEAKLLCRNAIGVDINYHAVMITMDRLNFDYGKCNLASSIHIYHGDARNLDLIKENSIDFILTHPPYGKIISYSRKGEVMDDLSTFSYKEYLSAIREIAHEFFRVLKPNKHCAILIGDTRKNKHYVPISHDVMDIFLSAGFILKENIIKVQWNTTKTRSMWSKLKNDFYLIAHENLFVFRKPIEIAEYRKYKFSSRRDHGKL